MSNRFFPSFPCMRLVSRTSLKRTVTQGTDSARQLRIKKGAPGQFRYTFEISLRSWLSEDSELSQFHDSHEGAYESFLLVDPKDGATRRVHFVDDELGPAEEVGGISRVQVELETVVV